MKKKGIMVCIIIAILLTGILIVRNITGKEEQAGPTVDRNKPQVQYRLSRWEEEGIDAYLKDMGVPEEKLEETKQEMLNLPTGSMALDITGNRATWKKKHAVHAEINEILEFLVTSKDSEKLVEMIEQTSPEIVAVIHEEIARIVEFTRDPVEYKREVWLYDFYEWLISS